MTIRGGAQRWDCPPVLINYVAVSIVEIISMIGVVQEDLPIQIKLP